MNIQSASIRPSQHSVRPAPAPAPPAPSLPQESFVPSQAGDSVNRQILKGTAKVGLVAGGAALGAMLGSASGFAAGAAGAVVGVIGGATLGFLGGALSTKVISFDDYGLSNVFGGATIGAIGGLAAGIAAGGVYSGAGAAACLGLLGAGVGTLAAIQV